MYMYMHKHRKEHNIMYFMSMLYCAPQTIEDRNELAGYIRMVKGDYDLAQDLFMRSSNPLAALEVRTCVRTCTYVRMCDIVNLIVRTYVRICTVHTVYVHTYICMYICTVNTLQIGYLLVEYQSILSIVNLCRNMAYVANSSLLFCVPCEILWFEANSLPTTTKIWF